jgi:hypothetical protein
MATSDPKLPYYRSRRLYQRGTGHVSSFDRMDTLGAFDPAAKEEIA